MLYCLFNHASAMLANDLMIHIKYSTPNAFCVFDNKATNVFIIMEKILPYKHFSISVIIVNGLLIVGGECDNSYQSVPRVICCCVIGKTINNKVLRSLATTENCKPHANVEKMIDK